MTWREAFGLRLGDSERKTQRPPHRAGVFVLERDRGHQDRQGG